MKILKISSQFKKDLKKYKHRPDELDVLEQILNLLQQGKPIPTEYKPHMLLGDYKGHMECHVKNDLLLIWFDKMKGTIVLVRFGSNSELF
jgi:mRNA interferase YafQ